MALALVGTAYKSYKDPQMIKSRGDGWRDIGKVEQLKGTGRIRNGTNAKRSHLL